MSNHQNSEKTWDETVAALGQSEEFMAGLDRAIEIARECNRKNDVLKAETAATVPSTPATPKRQNTTG